MDPTAGRPYGVALFREAERVRGAPLMESELTVAVSADQSEGAQPHPGAVREQHPGMQPAGDAFAES